MSGSDSRTVDETVVPINGEQFEELSGQVTMFCCCSNEDDRMKIVECRALIPSEPTLSCLFAEAFHREAP